MWSECLQRGLSVFSVVCLVEIPEVDVFFNESTAVV